MQMGKTLDDILTVFMQITRMTYAVSQKTVQNCFCQNLVKFPSILIIFGRMMAKRLKICKVLIFYLTYSRHHTTMLNAGVPNCCNFAQFFRHGVQANGQTDKVAEYSVTDLAESARNKDCKQTIVYLHGSKKWAVENARKENTRSMGRFCSYVIWILAPLVKVNVSTVSKDWHMLAHYYVVWGFEVEIIQCS